LEETPVQNPSRSDCSHDTSKDHKKKNFYHPHPVLKCENLLLLRRNYEETNRSRNRKSANM
ncbi:hypothetical protein J6590_022424, partial [Homalodisca vitripennis]